MTTLTRPGSGEKQNFSDSGHLGIFPGNMICIRDIFGKFDIFAGMSPKKIGKIFQFSGTGLKLHAVLLKQRLLQLSPPVVQADFVLIYRVFSAKSA